jgi:Polyketide cyclase / dehydrase and lipid transport
MGTTARAEGIAPAHPDRTFEVLTPIDPSRFYGRFGPIPATIKVTDQTGAWDGVGQSRVLHLSDGSQLTETTKEVDEPRRFVYELTHFTKLFGALVSYARAEWDFDAAEGGTRIRWSYTFHGQPARGWIIFLIVKLAWAPYMRRVLPKLIEEVRTVTAA